MLLRSSLVHPTRSPTWILRSLWVTWTRRTSRHPFVRMAFLIDIGWEGPALLPVIHPLVLRLSSPSDKSRIRFHAARSCLDSSGSCPVTGLSYAQESNTAAGVLTFLYHGHVTRHCSTSIRLLHCLTPLHFMQPISTQFCIRRGSSCPSNPSPFPLAKGRNLPRPLGVGEYSPTWVDLGSPSCLQAWQGAMDGRVQRE